METTKKARNVDEIIHRLLEDKKEMERQSHEDYKRPEIQTLISNLKRKNKSYGYYQ
jgi:hypothetical protein